MTNVKIQIDPSSVGESPLFTATANSDSGHRYTIHAPEIDQFIGVVAAYMPQFNAKIALLTLKNGAQVTAEYKIDEAAASLLFQQIAVYRQLV
ncbi:MAG: hypothetical protein JWQ49_1767 [Edaphobacter sp.]|nr:hypothetical protein [Edaphobacter sp.]